MRARKNVIWTILLTGVLGWTGLSLLAGEGEIKTEQLLPANTVVALVMPDLSATRASWDKTRFAQMLKQPEMQAFFKAPCARLMESYEALRQASPVFPAFTDLDAGLLSGEVGVGVYLRDDPALPLGGLLTIAPKDPAAFLRMLPPDFRQALQTGELVPMGRQPDAPAMVWKKQRLVFCFPQTEAAGVLARLENPAGPNTLATAADFQKARKAMTNPAGWLYANAPLAKQLLTRMGQKERELPQVLAVLQMLGIDDLTFVTASLGFSETDVLMESFVGLVQQPKSPLLALLDSPQPFPADLLKLAPADAPYVWAGRFSWSKVMENVRKIVGQLDPNAAQEMEKGLGELRKNLGFDLQEDLLAQLGDEMLMVEPAVDTAPILSFMPGLVICMPVKDGARLEQTLAKLQKVVTALLQDQMRKEKQPILELLMPELRRTEYRGRSILYVHGPILTSPTSVCVAGDKLLVGTSVNAVRRLLDQLDQPANILGNRDFQETLARLTGKPFSAQALPSTFAFGQDRSSGTASLMVSGAGLVGSAIGLGVLQNTMSAGPGATAMKEDDAIRSCETYAEAQDIYHQTDWDKDGVNEYAQSFRGDFSLYDKKAGQADMLLIDEALANAEGEPGGEKNKLGYRFKQLKEQGANADGGAKSYIKNGNQTEGYAMVAYPAQYGRTGKRTFMVCQEGTVFAKDLGPQTAELVAQMKSYNPDGTWAEVEAKNDDLPLAGGDQMERFIGSAGGKAAIRTVRDVDLALWPDGGFFAKHRRATGGVALRTADGILWRTELPPPAPGTNISSTAMVTSVPIMAGLMLPVLARARTQARRSSSGNNLGNLIKCCHLFSDAAVNDGKFPKNALELYPNYVKDARVFQNPNNPGADASYYYIPGSTPVDATNIVFYEWVPEGREREGRNIAIGAGSVEWVTEAEFQERLKETAKALKENGIEMKPIPLPFSKLQQKAPAGDF